MARRPAVAFIAGLFLAGLALRPPVVGVGPLIPAIQDDLGVSHAVVGLLGTIPVLCMGLFALPAPALSRRFGSRLSIAACLALIGLFGVARAAAPEAAVIIVLTFGVGIGLGFAQALMPVAVKERFAGRPALATGIYVLGSIWARDLVRARGAARARGGQLALVGRDVLPRHLRAGARVDLADPERAGASAG